MGSPARFLTASVTAAPPMRLSGDPGAPRLRGWIHLGALALALVAGPALVLHSAGGQGEPSVILYALALVGLYGVSSAYHLLPLGPPWRGWMRRIDHAAIYAFIAAAYSPFCLLVVRGRLGAAILAAVWVGATVGVVSKMARFDRVRSAAGALYVVLGWLAVLTLPRALHRFGWTETALFLGTGIAYTLGCIVLVTRRPDPAPDTFGYHEVWHALVVVGGACYYALIWQVTTAGR